MTLQEWVAKKGRGEISRLMRVTGLAYTTVLNIAHGARCKYETGKSISDATGGAVSIAELCDRPAASTPAPDSAA